MEVGDWIVTGWGERGYLAYGQITKRTPKQLKVWGQSGDYPNSTPSRRTINPDDTIRVDSEEAAKLLCERIVSVEAETRHRITAARDYRAREVQKLLEPFR